MSAQSPAGPELDRRGFILAAMVGAGGLVLGIGDARGGPTSQPSGPAGVPELSAWIEIAADDQVTVRVPTPEIGNGVATQIAMTIAEELECDWSRVRIATASVRRDYEEGRVYSHCYQPFFAGHSTEKARHAKLLQLGASARERLKRAAAARWGVPPDEIMARNSLLVHSGSGRNLRYGELSAEAAEIGMAEEPLPKPPGEWRLLGKASPAKLHIPEIVEGRAVYGIDVQVPGMLHAALKQAPVHGGRLRSHKPRAVLSMPGVRAVIVVDPADTVGSPVKPQLMLGLGDSHVQSAVAVVADHYWQAKTALEALPVEWDDGDGARWKGQDDIYAAARALQDEDGAAVLIKSGDAGAVLGRVVEATYQTPYCENAPLEPLNATAMVTTGGEAEIWCPTQNPQQAWWAAIDETGFAPERVSLHPTYVGGGFGRRTQAEDVRMAVAVARQHPGVPIKVIWTREECFRQGRYRTPVTTRFRATLGPDGYPVAMTARTVFVGGQTVVHLPYALKDSGYVISGAIPNILIDAHSLPMHLLTGAFRGPSYNSHGFMVDGFIDECAAAAGIDPLQYRLKLLAPASDPSWRRCLSLAAEKAGWERPLEAGKGIGLAVTAWGGTIVAVAARVSVTQAGELAVEQVDLAFDCGRVANSDAVRAQLEGGTLFGLNVAVNEEVTVKDGAVVEGNFDEYPMLRIADVPRVNVHFEALSGDDRLSMIGEAPMGPIGAAIGNAIYRATGKRLRSTPFRRHDLTWS